MRISREALAQLPPDEKLKVEAELKALAKFYEENPLLTCIPHGKQVEFLSARDRLKAFIGGNRSGKTTAGIIDCLIQAVDREALPPHLLQYKQYEPPFFCRIVTPDFKQTLNGVIVPKLREWTPRGALREFNFDKAYMKNDQMLHFENGSWFQFMTHEQDLDKFGGAALHRILYDEEPPEDIRKECLMRLMDHNGDEVFCFTPLNGMSWAYDEIWKKRNQKGVHVTQVQISDNPHVSKEARDRILEEFHAEEREAREKGKFVHFAGVVYPEWSQHKHLTHIEPDMLGGKWIVVGIDPGISNTGLCWVAFDDDNNAFIFDALKLNDELVESVAAQIRVKNSEWGIEPDVYVIDPNSRVRSPITGETLESAYIRNGILAIYGQNDVPAGINQIRTLLREGKVFVQAGLSPFLNEIERYRIDSKARERGKFEVIKKNDHVMDAWRYAIMSRVWGMPDDDDSDTPAIYHNGEKIQDYLQHNPRSGHPLGPMT